MALNSRTSKSIRNSVVALGMYFFNLILQFYSRKIFLDYLGTEILGLNTTLSNILQCFNLAELGIGSAVGCTLYKPLKDREYNEINKIVSLQGLFYKRIAWLIIIGSIILFPFFPYIFASASIPLWYTYSSYSVLLFSSLLGYFFNYKQIVLSANQEEYKIQYTYKLSMSLKLLFQSLAMLYFPYPYEIWLLFEFLFAIIASILLKLEIHRSAPYLVSVNERSSVLKKEYGQIIKKIKQLFFHKIAGFALLQISPLIIYAYTSLNTVTIYGNYLIIYLGLTTLSTAVFNGINASIGNLFVTGNKQHLLKVFNELFSLRIIIAITVSFLFYKFAPSFITLWIGSEYLLPENTQLLLAIMLFISLNRQTTENFINAMGLFHDIWAPIVELSINIAISIILGNFFGLNGVLMGVILSLIPIVVIWKPFFLFRYGFHIDIKSYWILFFSNLSVGLISIVIGDIFYSIFCCENIKDYGQLILYMSVSLCLIVPIMLGGLKMINSPLFLFFNRIKSILSKR